MTKTNKITKKIKIILTKMFVYSNNMFIFDVDI